MWGLHLVPENGGLLEYLRDREMFDSSLGVQ